MDSRIVLAPVPLEPNPDKPPRWSRTLAPHMWTDILGTRVLGAFLMPCENCNGGEPHQPYGYTVDQASCPRCGGRGVEHDAESFAWFQRRERRARCEQQPCLDCLREPCQCRAGALWADAEEAEKDRIQDERDHPRGAQLTSAYR